MGMREIYRSIARSSMIARGVTRINKKLIRVVRDKDGNVSKTEPTRSYFAENWRKEAAFALNGELRENIFRNAKKRRLIRNRHRKATV